MPYVKNHWHWLLFSCSRERREDAVQDFAYFPCRLTMRCHAALHSGGLLCSKCRCKEPKRVVRVQCVHESHRVCRYFYNTPRQEDPKHPLPLTRPVVVPNIL